jgi:uncharacterized protein DUF6503
MRNRIVTIAFSMLALVSGHARAGDMSAADLADAVTKASGIEHWPHVKTIKFTFNVAKADSDKPDNSFSHLWDVKKMTDTITVNGKTMTTDIMHPGSDEDSKKAFARWTNDSYWLTMPLKLKDGGVNLSTGSDETIDGKSYHVLHMSFGSVGLTPGDHYNLYIDPQTSLVAMWDYKPAPDKKTRYTWESYKDFSGLKLATEHKGGGRRIYFTDVEVLMD